MSTIDTNTGPWWGETWAWVAGYTSVSTLVIVFNTLLPFSVITNKYLHYSFNYVLVMLAVRNICRVILTMTVLVLSKMTPAPPPIAPIWTNVTSDSISSVDPVICEIVCMADHLLMLVLMFYLSTLSVYILCREPNPSNPLPTDMSIRLYGLNSGIIPVRERGWVSPLLVLVPLLFAILLTLPVPLLHKTHPLAVIPEASICQPLDWKQFNIFQSSIIILGFYLPTAIILFTMIGLSIRRCFNCSADKCVSSFCKEELVLFLLSLPTIIIYQLLHLPLLKEQLSRLSVSPDAMDEVMEVLTPEVGRALEICLGLLLPALVYCNLPAYTKFSSAPDESDIMNEVHRASRTPSRRISVASEAF